ncbi:hypothetical protein [Georgenia wangjunii]|uniref:hypothetical protein n=1 Tax=Georgenia wangjunii TaxID=3117730 RepID=UPI002F262FED
MGDTRRTAALAALAVLLLAGCSQSEGDERLVLVADRLEHFQEEFAGDGVLVPPVLARGSAALPAFDFDVEEGFVLTIYCIGEATLDVRFNGEPSDSGAVRCDNGQMGMARNAPDITADESNVVVSADDEDSYWLAAVTRSTDRHRDGTDVSDT